MALSRSMGGTFLGACWLGWTGVEAAEMKFLSIGDQSHEHTTDSAGQDSSSPEAKLDSLDATYIRRPALAVARLCSRPD